MEANFSNQQLAFLMLMLLKHLRSVVGRLWAGLYWAGPVWAGVSFDGLRLKKELSHDGMAGMVWESIELY